MDREIVTEKRSDIKPDTVILPETHSPMYLVHKYWARKPANIVAEYIKKYSNPGETVYDPFFGSGVTIFESLIHHRNVVGIDLNPFSSFLVATMLSPFHEETLENAVSQLESEISEILKIMYSTPCPKCNNDAIITHTIYSIEKNSEDNHENITDIYLQCPECGKVKSQEKSLINQLIKKNEEIDKNFEYYKAKFDSRFPDFTFRYPDGNNFAQLRHNLIKKPSISELFTKRALLVLGAIYSKIMSVNRDESTRQHLRLAFSSSLAQASKMVWVISKRKNKSVKNKEAGSWTHHFFWNPNEFFEVHGWNSFKNRVGKLAAGKRDLKKRLKSAFISDYKVFDEIDKIKYALSNNPSLFAGILNQSSSSSDLPDESIDFIFTDPPYGDSIQYFELSSMWNIWLGLNPAEKLIQQSVNHEIIVNPKQKKNLDDYKKRLKDVFTDCHRILKDRKYMIVTFHNTDMKIRNALIESITESGFFLEQITFQMPPRASIKSMLHHQGSPVGDLFIRFQKNTKRLKTIDKKGKWRESELLQEIEAIISSILTDRSEPTYWMWISTFIDQELFKRGIYPLPDIESLIKKLLAKDRFIIDKDQRWWFRYPSNESIENRPLNQRIEIEIKSIIKTIEDRNEVTVKQYVFNELYKKFSGTLTPDKLVVSKILEQHLKLHKGA